YTIDQYVSSTVVNTITLPDFIRTAGGDTTFDSIPINRSGNFLMLPAVKKAPFEVAYQGINQLQNFEWVEWDGSDFDDWLRETVIGEQIQLQRNGSGTLEDPYKAFMPYPNSSNAFRFWQVVPVGTVELGDIIELQVKS